MHNKNNLIIIAAVVLLVVGGGLFYFVTKKAPAKTTASQDAAEEEAIILKPEDVGLEFNAKEDKKYVKFVINKPEGIEHVDYDILYDAISNGEQVSQGLTGEISKEEFGKETIGINYRELGTCSTGGKCRFDEGVKKVTLVLRLTKTDGKIYKVEKSIDL